MELTTGILPTETILAEVDALIALLRSIGVIEANVSLGFGCNVDIEEQYDPQMLNITDLRSFINERIRAGDFEVGGGDLWIEIVHHPIEILLCHERDIHVKSSCTSFCDEVRKRWMVVGYNGFQKIDEKWEPLQ